MIKEKPAALLMLEDGSVFYGKPVGKIGTTTGEICFNTGMTGYQEIFTDPSYFGQLIVTTNVHIGNYGTKQDEEESEGMKIAGLICKNFTKHYSRQQADHSIQEYFENQDMVGIASLDTRAIVKHVRDKGAMNAIISSEITDEDILRAKLAEVPPMEGLELASKVSTQQEYTVGHEHSTLRVAVLDFGIKRNILNCMVERGCYVKVFPAKTTFESLMAFQPHGVFLSNGPGDPAPMNYAVETTKKVIDHKIPLFGICLGHQILALANDIPTYKMHHGHRGINHPVKNLSTGKCEITSQNHGFGVSADAIRNKVDLIEVTHINLNDQTVEGIKLKHAPAFSVQFHPESTPGPHDSRYLFDDFIRLMQAS